MPRPCSSPRLLATALLVALGLPAGAQTTATVTSSTEQGSIGLSSPTTPPVTPSTPAARQDSVVVERLPTSPVSNPLALTARAPVLPEGQLFGPDDWPDDAGTDGLVVPAEWLWARVGHSWSPQERARRLADRALWRAGGETPQGWIPSGTPGPAGWIAAGPQACESALRIAYALRLHRIPLTIEEQAEWDEAKRAVCPQRWAGARAAAKAPDAGQADLWMDAPRTGPITTNPMPPATAVSPDPTARRGALPTPRPAPDPTAREAVAPIPLPGLRPTL